MKHLTRKVFVFGMIFLFVGISVVSGTKTWMYANVNCVIDGLSSDDVTWSFAFPPFVFYKRFVWNLNLNATEGDGAIEITPRGKPTESFNFSEDFNHLHIMFFHSMPAIIAPYFHFGLGHNGSYQLYCWGNCWIIKME